MKTYQKLERDPNPHKLAETHKNSSGSSSAGGLLHGVSEFFIKGRNWAQEWKRSDEGYVVG